MFMGAYTKYLNLEVRIFNGGSSTIMAGAMSQTNLQASAAARPGADGLLRLSDGRGLGFAEFGDPSGLPVMAFHGMPGCRFMFRLVHEPALRLGLRIIAPDRPGFGLSSFQPGRTLADWARDVRELADSLGLDRFAVAGISGGGPYVAASAALLPERISAAALVSPVGPLHAPDGPDRLPPAQLVAFRLLPQLTPAMRLAFFGGRLGFLYAPDAMYRAVMKRAGPADEAILSRPEIRKNILESVVEGLRPGAKGVVQEMKIFAAPWNIPFAAIKAPAMLWQGMADNNVPVPASLRLAQIIPNCELFRIEGAGHYWIFEHVEEVLTAIRHKVKGAQPL
jgi:pimeloyl-ACP methyl ester carboxylesterase